jgi:hypothetical protein
LCQGTMPDLILLEDANDLIDFLEETCRTIPRAKWAEESKAAVADAMAQNMCGI